MAKIALFLFLIINAEVNAATENPMIPDDGVYELDSVPYNPERKEIIIVQNKRVVFPSGAALESINRDGTFLMSIGRNANAPAFRGFSDELAWLIESKPQDPLDPLNPFKHFEKKEIVEVGDPVFRIYKARVQDKKSFNGLVEFHQGKHILDTKYPFTGRKLKDTIAFPAERHLSFLLSNTDNGLQLECDDFVIDIEKMSVASPYGIDIIVDGETWDSYAGPELKIDYRNHITTFHSGNHLLKFNAHKKWLSIDNHEFSLAGKRITFCIPSIGPPVQLHSTIIDINKSIEKYEYIVKLSCGNLVREDILLFQNGRMYLQSFQDLGLNPIYSVHEMKDGYAVRGTFEPTFWTNDFTIHEDFKVIDNMLSGTITINRSKTTILTILVEEVEKRLVDND